MANSDQAHVTSSALSSEVHLEDCVKALKRFNDKHFDLAIVDPPLYAAILLLPLPKCVSKIKLFGEAITLLNTCPHQWAG